MKKIKYLIIGVAIFCLFGTMNVKAEDISITGNSVFRENATSASVNFISNSDGNIYYKITSSNAKPIPADIVTASDGGSITANTTKNILLTELTSGAKYVHIIVKNENILSNVLTIDMPKDVYYYDDFEAYNIDTYPSFFKINHNGSDSTKQRIIDLNANKVFNAYGTYGTGLEERIQINPISSGYAVLEADISSSVMSTDWYFGGLFIGLDRNINVLVHPTSKKFVGANYFTGSVYRNMHISDIVFKFNTNYHVKIVVDVENKKFNYYINGIKANLESINAGKTFDQLTYFGIYNGSGSVQYDNIKFYTQATNSINHSITKEPQINGTFTISKSSAEENEVITVVPTPEAGYRVKSVKINDSESGIIKNNANYEFTMPAEDVVITVEFEKLPFTITVNEVTGATITPNGTTKVLYGDNKDITIRADLGYRLKSVKVNGVEKLPLSNNKITLENITENKEVILTVEKLPFTITVNEVTGATITPNGTINVLYGDNKDITIRADLGYRLKSVKVNGVEKLPLSNNKITLENITENKEVILTVEKLPFTITADLGYKVKPVKVNRVEKLPLSNNKVTLENITKNKEEVVTVEKIEYDVTNGDSQKHIIGQNEDAVFKINANKDLFLKVYLNDEQLDSEFYTITEGSTIISLKKEFLNNLLPGKYNLRATFSDGGEATATFVIAQPAESNQKTGDGIMISIIIGSISLIGLLGISLYLKKKRFN